MMSNWWLVVLVNLLVWLSPSDLFADNNKFLFVLSDDFPPPPPQAQLPLQHQQQQPSIVRTSNNNNINYSSNTNTENIAIGNTNTNNYNFQQSSYRPTQLTQVVLNVPKAKKLRISRPPTEEEFAIKRKILDVYEGARRDTQVQSINFDHLGRILEALNPKYIATERVRRVAFGDPSDPSKLAPILSLEKPEALSTLSLGGSNVIEQLELLIGFFRTRVSWELSLVNLLANTDERELSPEQAAFRSLLLCLTQADFCPTPQGNSLLVGRATDDPAQQFAEMMDQQQQKAGSASALKLVYAPEAHFLGQPNIQAEPQPQSQAQLRKQFQPPNPQLRQQFPPTPLIQTLQQQPQLVPQQHLTPNRPPFYPAGQAPQAPVGQRPAGHLAPRFKSGQPAPRWQPRANNNFQQGHSMSDSPFQRLRKAAS